MVNRTSLPTNTFKAALAARRRLAGLWVNYATAPVVEVLAGAGFDWLLIDMEHTAADVAAVGTALLALRGGTAAPVVRVPALDATWLKRVLDAGAPNVMVPNVRSAAEARDAVAYTRFAPEGLRGVASSTRAGHYTRHADFLARANDEIGLVLQIESRGAVEDIDGICAVPGVDAVFVGPSDLAAALGHRGQPGHDTVQAAIAHVFARALAAGRACGILAVDGNVARYAAQGATMLGVGTDMHLLLGAADALAARFSAPG